jgi:hypothetical protein
VTPAAGRICLWRYTDAKHNHPGFHLSADVAGCNQLLRLLGTLAKARKSELGTVVLDPVGPAELAVPNARHGNARFSSYARWELLVDPRFPPEQLRFVVTNDRVRTELSPAQVESLIGGVQDIREGRGDYGIGDEDEHMLTFWWQTGGSR